MRLVTVALSALLSIANSQGRSAVAAEPADAAANRKASAAYDADLRSNPAFLGNREHEECDPIQSLDLRAQCVASFEQPAVTPPKPAAEPDLPSDIDHPTVTITNGPVHDPGDE